MIKEMVSMFSITNLTLKHVKEICSWHYNDEYAVYDYPSYKIVKKDKWSIANRKKRKKEYVAVIDKDKNLCGIFRVQNLEEGVYIGLGLKPSICGQGYGNELMKIILDLCNHIYPGRKLLLEVKTFNNRAIKCYEKVGFKIVDTITKITPNGKDEYYKMEL
jgi:RimJ/RimL family protein N-acetyltransferase